MKLSLYISSDLKEYAFLNYGDMGTRLMEKLGDNVYEYDYFRSRWYVFFHENTDFQLVKDPELIQKLNMYKLLYE